MWRSLLFVPILNDRLIAGAARRGADAIVLDLEAAVPPERKVEARAALKVAVSRINGGAADIAVRINTLEQGGDADLSAAMEAGADLIVLPHATPESVARAAALAGDTRLIPLIESPRGVIDALAIAGGATVAGLGLGVEDYAAAMGAPPSPDLLTPAAFQVIQAARAAGCQPLITPDTIARYADHDRFETAVIRARAMGSSGGFAIHPAQVAILNRVFAPTPEDRREAEAIIAAADDARRNGLAIARLDGRMIDEPVEARARAVMRAWRRFNDQDEGRP